MALFGDVTIQQGSCRLVSGEHIRLEGHCIEVIIQHLSAHDVLNVQRKLIVESGTFPSSIGSLPVDLHLLVSADAAVVKRLQTLRGMGPHVPILVISMSIRSVGEQLPEDTILMSGADAVCCWPEDAAVLPARIKALLRRRSGLFAIDAKRLQLLHGERRLLVANEAFQLSPLEYALVSLLDQNRNQWVPASELWQALALSSQAYDSSLLRMHLFRLRKKLGPWRELLRSARGRGVMLSDPWHAPSATSVHR